MVSLKGSISRATVYQRLSFVKSMSMNLTNAPIQDCFHQIHPRGHVDKRNPFSPTISPKASGSQARNLSEGAQIQNLPQLSVQSDHRRFPMFQITDRTSKDHSKLMKTDEKTQDSLTMFGVIQWVQHKLNKNGVCLHDQVVLMKAHRVYWNPYQFQRKEPSFHTITSCIPCEVKYQSTSH